MRANSDYSEFACLRPRLAHPIIGYARQWTWPQSWAHCRERTTRLSCKIPVPTMLCACARARTWRGGAGREGEANHRPHRRRRYLDALAVSCGSAAGPAPVHLEARSPCASSAASLLRWRRWPRSPSSCLSSSPCGPGRCLACRLGCMRMVRRQGVTTRSHDPKWCSVYVAHVAMRA